MRWPFSGRARRIADAAARWRVQMESPDSAAQVAAFEAWLKEDPAHLQAYQDYDGIADLGQRADTASIKAHAGLRGRLAGGALALGVLVCVGIGSWWAVQERSPAYTAIVNRTAAVRAYALADGTHMMLDVGAAVAVPSDRAVADLRLSNGRVRIAVGQGTRGAVNIATSAGRVRLGPGTFDLIAGEGVVRVRALAGEATWVGLAGDPALRARVTQGRASQVRDGQEQSLNVATLDANWPDARVAFERTPLRAVLRRANRGRSPQVIVTDPTVAALQVTGVLDLRDTRRLARKLAAALGLVAAERDDTVLLHR